MALQQKPQNRQEIDDHYNRSDHNRKFYEEYKKIFSTGYYLSVQLKDLVMKKQHLWKRLLDYEKKAEQDFKDKMRKEAPERKKRHRRTAQQIQKKYFCNVHKCNNQYGSEGSLIQHYKLKHPQLLDSLLKNKKRSQFSESYQNDSYE